MTRRADAAAALIAPVDVVVPSFNHGRFVEGCLRSIFAQTVKPAFLLVIDDGSSDGSPHVIGKALEDCPFPCELVARPNRGLCATLNEALDRTSSPFFAYLASDDLWMKRRLERAMALLGEEADAVAAYSNFLVCDDTGRTLQNLADCGYYPAADLFDALMRVTCFPHNNTLTVRRSAVAGFRWDPAATIEDYPLLLHLACQGRFAFSPEPLACWRQHGGNAHRRHAVILNELLREQRRHAAAAGMAPEQLRACQGAFRFRYANHLLRYGHRWHAAWLTLAYARHAASRWVLLQQMLRLLSPAERIRLPDFKGPLTRKPSHSS